MRLLQQVPDLADVLKGPYSPTVREFASLLEREHRCEVQRIRAWYASIGKWQQGHRLRSWTELRTELLAEVDDVLAHSVERYRQEVESLLKWARESGRVAYRGE